MKIHPALAVTAAVVVLLALSRPDTLKNPVDIYAALDLPSSSLGPRTFEVTKAMADDGPELTVENETSNPSDWCGDVKVDIDPGARTITVTRDQESCSYETAVVRIATNEIASVDVVSDELASRRVSEGKPLTAAGATLDVAVTSEGVVLTWTSIDGEKFYLDGVSVFSYEQVHSSHAGPATPATVAPSFAG
jgi:hypothetical protein